MPEGFWEGHEKVIRRTRTEVQLWLLLAGLSIGFPLLGIGKPPLEALGAWWLRGGAPTVVFALLAQNKAQHLGELLIPGAFTSDDMERLRAKYRLSHKMLSRLALVLTIVGTSIWGYGDLIFAWATSRA